MHGQQNQKSEGVPEDATLYAAPAGRSTAAGREAADVLARAGVAPKLDRQTALGFLVHDAYDARRTFFERLAPVPMRCIVIAHADGSLAVETPPGPKPIALDAEEAGTALRDTLDAAVEDAIRDAARVAITASGGLDSNAIAASASIAWRRLGRDPNHLRLYHLLPRGPSEVEHARALSAALAHPLVVIDVPAGDSYEGNEAYLAALDFPVDGGGSSGWLKAYAAMRDDGMEVVLSGDGGDEAVGDVPGPERSPLLRAARRLAGRIVGPARRAASRRRARVGLPAGLAAAARGIDEPERTPLPRRGLRGGAAARDRALRSARQSAMVVSNVTMARLFGLRHRSPFLDPRVSDLLTALPAAAFERDRHPKALLVRALEGRVPQGLGTRGKDQPAYEPLFAEDIRAHGDAWLDRFLHGSRLEASGLLSLADARAILGAAGTGDEAAIARALALLGLSAWARARDMPS